MKSDLKTILALFVIVLCIYWFIIPNHSKADSNYNNMAAPAKSASKFIHLRYEVTGKVQGVFFRKCTKDQADKLKLVGWVQNTMRKSVIGEAEGTSIQINAMKQWLKEDSSKIPYGKGSKINVKDARFEMQDIEKLTFEEFVVDRQGIYKDFTLF